MAGVNVRAGSVRAFFTNGELHPNESGKHAAIFTVTSVPDGRPVIGHDKDPTDLGMVHFFVPVGQSTSTLKESTCGFPK